ncbi:MAG: S49 family peptidase, partial [Polyangiaceae bacterium]|nr:S49 family peptidase [Polyangiaceae bacterium]
MDGATTLDLSLLLRRSRFFAFSLVGYDVLGPLSIVGLDGSSTTASLLGAFTFRPNGDEHLTIEGFGAVASDFRVGFGGLAAVGLPRGGRISAKITVEHFRYQREQRFVAGVDVPWDRFAAYGGAIAGEGYAGRPGFYAGAVVGERPVESLPGFRFVHEIVAPRRIDSEVLVELIERLQRAANDRRVRGVLLRVETSDLELAYAQEIRQSIETIRAAGKPVVCSVEASGVAAFYACTAADRTLVGQSVDVHLVQSESDVVSLEELFAEATIEADFVVSATAHANVAVLALDRDLAARLEADLSRSLGLSPDRLIALGSAGPRDASAAVEARLAHAVASESALDEALEDVVDGRVRRRRSLGSFGSRSWAKPRRVGVVLIAGPLIDREDVGERAGPDESASDAETVAAAIERLADDGAVRAIVLRVDSIGGSLLAAERIWRAVLDARQKKPVLASLGATATSGAYLIASACDEIFASPSTITGGLGLIFARAETAARTFQEFSEAERDALRARLTMANRSFVEKIAEAREVRPDEVERHSGPISGDRAVREGLVDRLGGFSAAVSHARALG